MMRFCIQHVGLCVLLKLTECPIMRFYSGILSFLSNTKLRMVGSTLLVLAIILLTMLIVLQLRNPSQQAALPLNPIQIENAQSGTVGWRVTKQGIGQIQAYTGEPSISKGGYVRLYVSTTSPSYSIDIYRLGYYYGVGARLVESIPASAGVFQGYYISNRPDPIQCKTCIASLKDSQGLETDITDANWALTNTIYFPSDWVSGIYYI